MNEIASDVPRPQLRSADADRRVIILVVIGMGICLVLAVVSIAAILYWEAASASVLTDDTLAAADRDRLERRGVLNAGEVVVALFTVAPISEDMTGVVITQERLVVFEQPLLFGSDVLVYPLFFDEIEYVGEVETSLLIYPTVTVGSYDGWDYVFNVPLDTGERRRLLGALESAMKPYVGPLK